MAQFKYGPEGPKKVEVQSHDGRTIEVPEGAAKLYEQKPNPKAEADKPKQEGGK